MIFETINDLQDAVAPTELTICTVRGYYSANDGGGGQFIWDPNSDANPDGGTIFESDPPQTTGRWERQHDHNGELNVKWFGAKGNDFDDDYDAIQGVLNFYGNGNTNSSRGITIYFPEGTYLLSQTLRESTNGQALYIKGQHKNSTFLKAYDSLPNDKPLLWVGNSNGHGNYRLRLEGISFEGLKDSSGDMIDRGYIGLRMHESGTSEISQFNCKYLDIGVEALGTIGSIFRGQGEISSCNYGVVLKRIPRAIFNDDGNLVDDQDNEILDENGNTIQGIDVDDTTLTLSPHSLNTNINTINNIWFTSVKYNAIKIEGGLTTVSGCTFQSCGGTNTSDVVYLLNANESKDYGGGSTVDSCWFEGTKPYRSFIRVENTRHAKILNNFLSGSNYPKGDSRNNAEQGVLVRRSPNVVVIGNSARGHWGADLVPDSDEFSEFTPQARKVNAWLYIDSNVNSLGIGNSNAAYIAANYFTKYTCDYYIGVYTQNSAQAYKHDNIILQNMFPPKPNANAEELEPYLDFLNTKIIRSGLKRGDLVSNSNSTINYNFDIYDANLKGLTDHRDLRDIDTGAYIFFRDRAPLSSDGKHKGDIFVDTTAPSLYFHVGSGVWKNIPIP